MTQNCDAVKDENRGAILLAEWMASAEGKIVARFCAAWRDFWIRLSYLGSYASTVARFSQAWRDFGRSKILFKHSMTHLLGKLGESHGNQRMELLGF